MGALVVKWTHDLRRVAESPSDPEGDQSRQIKYVDSSLENTRTEWPQSWVVSKTALRNRFWKIFMKYGLTPSRTWSRTLSPHPKPNAVLKRHNKVPANHVASQKLPYPLPGSGRRAGTLACSYTEAPNHVETMREQIHEHASNER